MFNVTTLYMYVEFYNTNVDQVVSANFKLIWYTVQRTVNFKDYCI
jgi:hypothetical protein